MHSTTISVTHLLWARARCREGRLGIRAERMVERGTISTSVRFGQAQGHVWGWSEQDISYEAEGLARATGRFNATMWWPIILVMSRPRTAATLHCVFERHMKPDLHCSKECVPLKSFCLFHKINSSKFLAWAL
jgi:hypothetical protein